METEKNKSIEAGNQLRWNRVKQAPDEEMEKFWRALRKFYRTGLKPKNEELQVKSALLHLLEQGDNRYPFKPHGNDKLSIELDEDTIFYMLGSLLNENRKAIKSSFKDSLSDLINNLNDILHIDDQEFKVGQLKTTYDFANEIIAFDKMVDVLPKPSETKLDDNRIKRLESVLEEITKGLKDYQNKEATILYDKRLKSTKIFSDLFNNVELICSEANSFEKAHQLYQDHIQSFTGLIKAYRIALLEIEGAYDSRKHDEYFEGFTQHSLTDEELSFFHPIIVLTDHDHVLNNLATFSSFLALNHAIVTLVLNESSISKPNPEVAWENAAHQFKQELGAFAIAHRNVFTFQTCLDNPDIVYQNLKRALNSNSTALCHISVHTKSNEFYKNISIAKARNAGRYFPGFTYDPLSGNTSSSLLTITNTIQPEKNWPTYTLEAITSDETAVMIDVAYTYADYKAIYSEKAAELMIIPPEFYTEDLIPLHDYLGLEETQLYGKIPYIWLKSEDNELFRAAVPNVWVVSCQERLDNWNFLQNLSIRNFNSNANENNHEEIVTKKESNEKVEQGQGGSIDEQQIMNSAIQRVVSVLLEDEDFKTDA